MPVTLDWFLRPARVLIWNRVPTRPSFTTFQLDVVSRSALVGSRWTICEPSADHALVAWRKWSHRYTLTTLAVLLGHHHSEGSPALGEQVDFELKGTLKGSYLRRSCVQRLSRSRLLRRIPHGRQG